jgi:hypothetical protein
VVDVVGSVVVVVDELVVVGSVVDVVDVLVLVVVVGRVVVVVVVGRVVAVVPGWPGCIVDVPGLRVVDVDVEVEVDDSHRSIHVVAGWLAAANRDVVVTSPSAVVVVVTKPSSTVTSVLGPNGTGTAARVDGSVPPPVPPATVVTPPRL